KLRAYVNVPQSYVPEVPIGTKAQVTVPEFPGQKFPATVEASARSVEVQSGTTRMLLVVDNPKGQLMTGAFANVSLELAHPQVSIVIPASALLFDQSGLRVATVTSNNKVALKNVTISRDLGKEVDIGSGLESDDLIITSPPDGLASGDQVKIAGDSPETAAAKRLQGKPPG
ncbi:MAG: efflux RND transporter periplasmic adaptor subunit, partial [Pseudolabrys sp.]|nr:efflux RND transporter periplasmic adaptor subunit [Pseudolabrys sp.]